MRNLLKYPEFRRCPAAGARGEAIGATAAACHPLGAGLDSPSMYRVIRQQGVTIIELGPRYDSLDDETLEEFGRSLLTEADQAEPPRLLLDLSHTTYVGSGFIELMVRVWKRVKMRGGTMALCGLQPFCAEVLNVTRLDTIWPIYPGRSKAVAELAER